MHRRSFFAALAVVASLALPAQAHHGWAWTTSGNIKLTGLIETAELGNPHGILTVRAEDEIWTVEAGQPWRHDRAGLDERLLAPGTEITVIGEPAADVSRKVVKAEQIIIGDETYVLYPDRT